MIKLSRKQFNELQEKVEEYLFSPSSTKAYDDFYLQLKLAKNKYYESPWYVRMFARTPTYNNLAIKYPVISNLQKIELLKTKFHDMDDWDINYLATDDDEFFISDKDFKFLESNNITLN